MERIQEICAHIPPCKTLADVGCDHGYCTAYAFKNGLCERAYISDISKGSLQKAETLLKKQIEAGKCFPVVADGMKGFKEEVDCVLIAGLGGEEITRILEEGYLPKYFVLQPMKNGERVRAFLVERGAKILNDYTFEDGAYYYDIIAGERAERETDKSVYSDWEIKYGRDNLKTYPPAFINKLRAETQKLRNYLKGIQKYDSREAVLKRIYETEVILNAVESDL